MNNNATNTSETTKPDKAKSGGNQKNKRNGSTNRNSFPTKKFEGACEGIGTKLRPVILMQIETGGCCRAKHHALFTVSCRDVVFVVNGID